MTEAGTMRYLFAALVMVVLVGGCSVAEPDTPATTSPPESVATTSSTTISPTTTTTISPGATDEIIAPATLPLTLEDGTRVDATLIGQDDLAGAFCAGYEASHRQMESDAQDSPDDFYLPLLSKDERRRECADFGTPAAAATIEQTFCMGGAANTIQGTRILAESPDLEGVVLVLLGACMGSHFAMELEGTPAYDDDSPIPEHALFAEGFVCYPSASWTWIRPLDVPYLATCPFGFDAVAGEFSVAVAFVELMIGTRQGTDAGQRDEAWFYEAYLLGAGGFDELIETSVLGENEAILGGDLFCAILTVNAEEGQPPYDGTLMAIKEVSFLLGIADSHTTLLGAFAAGALCDEAAYQYALELYEEVARG